MTNMLKKVFNWSEVTKSIYPVYFNLLQPSQNILTLYDNSIDMFEANSLYIYHSNSAQCSEMLFYKADLRNINNSIFSSLLKISFATLDTLTRHP